MTTFPAVVTIQDLPTGTTVTGTELLEVVQTSGGVAQSVQLSLSQIFGTTLGALPSGGATGQLLKSQGSGLLASWVNAASVVTPSTGLAASGSTTVALSLASTAGLSVLGVAATGSAVPTALAGTGAQTLRVNDAGTVLGFGALNLGSSAAVSGVLPGANYSAANLGASGAGGVQGLLPGTSIVTATIPGAQLVTATIGTSQLRTGPGLSVLAVNSSGTQAFSVITGAAGQLLAVNPAATGVAFVGGMVLLNTISPNNVATAGDTTSISSAFRNYMVTFENLCPVTQTTTLQLQVATSGSTFVSGGYVSQAQVNASSIIVTDTSTTVILLSGTRSTTQLQTTTTYGLNGFVKFFNPSSTAFRKTFVGDVSYLTPGGSATSTIAQAQLAGYFDSNSNALTALQFSFNSGNIQTGTIKVYGMA